MNARKATESDLLQVKAMFREIVRDMDARNIRIWDDYYPVEVFADDLQHDRLYVVEENAEIVAAFALCEEPDDIACLAWEDTQAPSLFLYRFGVSANHSRRGIGGRALREAEAFARELGAHYLKLLVVDINEPAIRFYEKSSYQKAPGIRNEPLGDAVLHEYGFEKKLVAPSA